MRAAERSGNPTDNAALERALRRLRHQQAIRRARVALQSDSVDEARRQSRLAFGQRKTARAGSVLLGMWLAPSLLKRVHPAKRRLQERVMRGLLQFRIRFSRQNRAVE